jgi:hypothetical protein
MATTDFTGSAGVDPPLTRGSKFRFCLEKYILTFIFLLQIFLISPVATCENSHSKDQDEHLEVLGNDMTICQQIL